MELLRRNRIFSRPTAVIILLISALVFIGFALIRSPTFIIPPADPPNPITAYVTDYGNHTRLVLRDNRRLNESSREGELVQYTYGDWNYFALDNTGLRDGLAALFIPTTGTLGRRQLEDITELQQELGSDWQDRILTFSVAQANSVRLMEALEQRFEQNIDTVLENPVRKIFFVQDDQDYTFFRNSNHELVEWLEELGCRVEGFVALPNFQLKQPES